MEIAQSVIEVKGIRPLAREIDVNPKSVFKYKKGNSHPGDEVMAKILAVADRDESVPLDEYLDRLSQEFSKAMERPIVSRDVVPEGVDEESTTSRESTGMEEKSVDRETTEEAGRPETVGKQTTEEISFDELCERIGVSSPFNQSKVRKIMSALAEEGELGLTELVELTGLSGEAVEKYAEKLKSEGIVSESPSGEFTISIALGVGD